jgi:two-component system chemotaxis sensor kinase CheA
MDDLIAEFITETNESLTELDKDLIKLEQNPNDKDLISKIFRLMHTIKGTCGFLGLPRLETVAHRAENVMGRFRDGNLSVTASYVSLILESLDRVRMLLEHIETNGTEPDGEDSDLIEKLDAVYEGRDAEQTKTETAPPPPPETPMPSQKLERELLPGEVSLDELERIFRETPVGIPDAAPVAPPPPPPVVEAVKVPVKSEPKSEPKADVKDAATSENSVANQSLRVNVDVLENLMTMVSELVLTRNQLMQISRAQRDNGFQGPLQRLNHVVSDLQDGVMKTRMQPIGNAWQKLPRIIRDLSIELGKKIDFVMVGEDTELDRQILEMIKDPLTHMVRNSGDHGIEIPADRAAKGKPETGTITLKAFHEGGHIIIQIIDDGKGLPMDKIKSKIIQNGLATEYEIAQMSTQQIQQYIFKAGFSTADKVTSVSGRGVGMDVVRTNIEKIGGAIELNSVEGKGSTFTIKIPLTLAIVSSLIVESAGERFAIPQLAVNELVLVSQKSDHKIEMLKGTPVFRLRNKLLPLVVLEDLLKISTNTTEDESRFNHKYIIVTQVGTYRFGIIVDRVFDTEEIVVKPVPKILKHINLFSGNTILGDGSVIMILDPNGIANATGDIDTQKAETSEINDASLSGRTKTSLLVFQAGEESPKAVPLALISRLENINCADIEYTNGQMMVQYRGKLMQLAPLNNNVVVGNTGMKPILVFSDRDNNIGLVIDRIIDIMEDYIDIQVDGSGDGTIGSTILQGHATDIIDAGYYLKRMNANWFKNHGDEPFESEHGRAGASKRRVLLIDDSPFFRNMLSPLLSVAGYDVIALESAVQALGLAEKGEKFDLIISDIEMPEMSGFEFAARIRAGSEWQNTPLVALSSHATPQDMDHGFKVGFNKYVAKFDRETLLNAINQTLIEGGRV